MFLDYWRKLGKPTHGTARTRPHLTWGVWNEPRFWGNHPNRSVMVNCILRHSRQLFKKKKLPFTPTEYLVNRGLYAHRLCGDHRQEDLATDILSVQLTEINNTAQMRSLSPWPSTVISQNIWLMQSSKFYLCIRHILLILERARGAM